MIHDRKQWGEAKADFGLADLPLEVTASAMEGKSNPLQYFRMLNFQGLLQRKLFDLCDEKVSAYHLKIINQSKTKLFCSGIKGFVSVIIFLIYIQIYIYDLDLCYSVKAKLHVFYIIATSFNDVVLKSANQISRADDGHHRKNWAPVGKTQLLSALENKTLAPCTIFPQGNVASPSKGATIILPKPGEQQKAPIGETIILPKKDPKDLAQAIVITTPEKKAVLNIGETITLPSKSVGEKVDKKGSEDSINIVNEERRLESAKEEQRINVEDDKDKDSAIRKTVNEIKNDEEEDDSDIEELTVVSDETVKGKEKPKARAVWGDDGKYVVDSHWTFINVNC